MSIAIAFLAGVCVMSVCAILAVQSVDSSNDALTAFLCGPVFWLYLAIGIPTVKIYRAVRLHDFKKNYVRVKVMGRGSKGENAYQVATWYIRKELVELFYTEGEHHDEAYIIVDGDTSTAKSYPYYFERTIDKNGFRYKVDAHDRFMCKVARDRIRPYSALYKKFELEG